MSSQLIFAQLSLKNDNKLQQQRKGAALSLSLCLNTSLFFLLDENKSKIIYIYIRRREETDYTLESANDSRQAIKTR